MCRQPIRRLREGSCEALVAGEAVVRDVPHPGADHGPGVERQLDPLGGGAQLRFTVRQRARRQHPPGGFFDDAQHASHLSRIAADRRGGNVEEHGFQVTVAVQLERPVLRGHALAVFQDTPQQRAQVVPDLGPGVGGGRAEGSRVLLADRRRIGVVVESEQLGAPEDQHLGRRGQHQVDRRAQAGRPVFGRPERMIPPVDGTHQSRRLAVVHWPAQRGRIFQQHGSTPVYPAGRARLLDY